MYSYGGFLVSLEWMSISTQYWLLIDSTLNMDHLVFTFKKNKKSALPVEHLGNSDDRHQSHKNIILQLIFSLGRHKTLE